MIRPFNKKLLVVLIAVSGLLSLPAQAQTILFPGVSGEALLDSLVRDYKPGSVLGYGPARDVMYGILDNENDSVTCVYSGYQVFVPFNDPNPRDYTNAANPIINAEHTWPQSKGAGSGNPRSDMHHLFPTNERPNSARGSLPFSEIIDSQTNRWYRKREERTSIPVGNIDQYSESLTNGNFEPREDHKGNVARAMFYFFTMYETEANAADPNFFTVQKEVLRRWNSMDPVDGDEVARSNGIAAYQDNKPNPFVVDTTLIGRAYFGVISGIDENVAVLPEVVTLLGNYPNPFNPSTQIRFALGGAGIVTVDIFDGIGRSVASINPGFLGAGSHEVRWNAENAASGIYYYRLTVGSHSKFDKMLLLR